MLRIAIEQLVQPRTHHLHSANKPTRYVRYGMVRRKRTKLRDRGPSADHGHSDRPNPAHSLNPWLGAGGGQPVEAPVREAPAPTPTAPAAALAPQPGMVPAPRPALARVTLTAGAAARVW